MNFLGFEITRRKAQNLQSVQSTWGGNWWMPIRESFAGAWQQNITVANDRQTLLSSSAVFCCITGIAGDMSKMPLRLVEKDDNGIWNEIDSPAFSPFLNNPNHYQTRLKFVEQWNVSKLLYGNTYALKERDNRGVVVRAYILHPLCVETLVAEDGSIWYKLRTDYLSQVDDERALIPIPASEIFHDTMVGFWHPLVGVSPLFACAASATLQSRIQNNSTAFFANRSIPGGILTAPGAIADETAARLKTQWEANYGGANSGRVAVLGDGLTFEQMTITADHAQLIDQLKWTVDDVARAFHYPRFKLGGDYPPVNTLEALQILYYNDCLQVLIEQMEATLDRGLGLDGITRGTEFDTNALWRMDSQGMFEALSKADDLTVNEKRKIVNYGPTTGGNAVYKQEQEHSLEALAKRDARDDPFTKQPVQNAPTPNPPANNPPSSDEMRSFDAEDLETFEGELIFS